MPNLAKYLLASNSLSHHPKPILLLNRKVKPRFFYIILSVIALILVVAMWDKLKPEAWVTSRYMQYVVSGE